MKVRMILEEPIRGCLVSKLGPDVSSKFTKWNFRKKFLVKKPQNFFPQIFFTYFDGKRF